MYKLKNIHDTGISGKMLAAVRSLYKCNNVIYHVFA